MNIELLSAELLPNWFLYPPLFLRIVVDQNLIDFDPWIIIHGERLNVRYNGLRERYPKRALVPFARREDNDDVACWEKGSYKVFIIHDFSSDGYESRAEYKDFGDWLITAVKDTIAFDA